MTSKFSVGPCKYGEDGGADRSQLKDPNILPELKIVVVLQLLMVQRKAVLLFSTPHWPQHGRMCSIVVCDEVRGQVVKGARLKSFGAKSAHHRSRLAAIGRSGTRWWF